nr:MAG TPA: hypothetical protein [Caudoviricetes sp.]
MCKSYFFIVLLLFRYVVFLVISLKLRIFAAVVVVDVANMLSFLITTINCDIFIS